MISQHANVVMNKGEPALESHLYLQRIKLQSGLSSTLNLHLFFVHIQKKQVRLQLCCCSTRVHAHVASKSFVFSPLSPGKEFEGPMNL